MTGASHDFAARVRRARREMEIRSVDALLLSIGSDLPYLTGYTAMASERLTMLVLPREGKATLVVPELEAPRVEPSDVFEIRSWGETEDPIDVVAMGLGEAAMVGVGDQTWATFVLRLQRRLPGVRFSPAAPLMATLRVRKDAGEIELLRLAGAAVDRVVDRLGDERFAGRTERELAHRVASLTVTEGCDLAAFTIVAAGPNAASPHHEPGDRVIESGDSVVIDFGGTVGGYCSDTTRTFHVGEPPAELAEAYEVLARAQQVGVEAALVGAAAQEVDRAARRVIDDAGYGGFFIHRTGHGIGLDVHEDPYLVEGNTAPLEPGMAFSVEPGIYVPGRFGMRIEDIVIATGEGPERINRSHRELRIVG